MENYQKLEKIGEGKELPHICSREDIPALVGTMEYNTVNANLRCKEPMGSSTKPAT